MRHCVEQFGEQILTRVNKNLVADLTSPNPA
jgi:hypothetical protein